MAVVKILVLFLLLEKRGNLGNGQILDYDYYPEESSGPPVNIPTDNELTHVRTKNLSGTVKLTTLQVLSTNRPVDGLNNEFEDWNNLEEATRSENKQYPQTENQQKVTLLSEVGTKAPTDGTESFTLMDVSNSTSGTLPDRSTEKLITVTSQTLRLIYKNSDTESITGETIDGNGETPNVNTQPNENDFKEAPNAENERIYSRVDEVFDVMKDSDLTKEAKTNGYNKTESMKLESQENIEDVSSFISVDEEFLDALSEEMSYKDEAIKDVDAIFKEFEGKTFEDRLEEKLSASTTENPTTEFLKTIKDDFSDDILFSTTQLSSTDDLTESTISTFKTTQKDSEEFESETPVMRVTETTSFSLFEESTLFTSKATDLMNDEKLTSATTLRTIEPTSTATTTEDFKTRESPFTSKPQREYVSQLNPTKVVEETIPFEEITKSSEETSSKLEEQMVFTSKPFYLSEENPVVVDFETTPILIIEDFESNGLSDSVTLSSIEKESTVFSIGTTSTSTIEEAELSTTTENDIVTKKNELSTTADISINDIEDATISKEDLVTEYEKAPSTTMKYDTEVIKINTDKVSTPILESTTEVKIFSFVIPKNRIETTTKPSNNFSNEFVKLLSSGITYFMRTFIEETTTHRTDFQSVETTNKESETRKTDEDNFMKVTNRKDNNDKRNPKDDERRNSTEIIWKHLLQAFDNRSKETPHILSRSKPVLSSKNHLKQSGTIVNSSKVNEEKSNHNPEIVGNIKEKVFKFSVKIIYNNTNFFVPSDSHLTQKSLNHYIIYWKSPNCSMNSSIEISLGNFVNLNFVERNHLLCYRTQLTKDVEKNLLYNNSITLENKVRIEFSNLDFLIKEEENEISPLTNALPSTPENSKTYVAEITGSCLGVLAVACILVYYVMKRIKSETRNFKPNSNV